jgi:hypothetical protein
VNYSIKNKTPYNLDGLLAMVHKFVPYAQKFLKYDKPVAIELTSDLDNAKNILGKTAYYDPENLTLAVYTDNRHPKDILRSLSHELVHHSQNCRGEFDKPHYAGEGYITKDPHLRNMEGEAYLLGNGFIIRFFEEYIKENGMLEEATNSASSLTLEGDEKEVPVQNEEPTPTEPPETIEEYRLRRKKIIADKLIRRWTKDK